MRRCAARFSASGCRRLNLFKGTQVDLIVLTRLGATWFSRPFTAPSRSASDSIHLPE